MCKIKDFLSQVVLEIKNIDRFCTNALPQRTDLNFFTMFFLVRCNINSIKICLQNLKINQENYQNLSVKSF